MPEQDYDKDFPNLKGIGYSRTSEPADYNCISYAVGDLDRWWWPSDRDDEYWPFPVPDPSKVNLETFIAGFAHVRFERCDSGNPEPGFEKIALYALADGTVKHAARLEEGKQRWNSKLGAHEDIEHTLEGVEGPCYGKPVAFFKRRVDLPPEAPGSSPGSENAAASEPG